MEHTCALFHRSIIHYNRHMNITILLSSKLRICTDTHEPASSKKSRPEDSLTQLRIWPGGKPQNRIFRTHDGNCPFSKPNAFCSSPLEKMRTKKYRQTVNQSRIKESLFHETSNDTKISELPWCHVRSPHLIFPGTQSGNSLGLIISSSDVASWYRFLHDEFKTKMKKWWMWYGRTVAYEPVTGLPFVLKNCKRRLLMTP